ncbi:hypothetical protein B0H13DRAFT_2304087 [Mycena leptocephala]|nr:hypothetical protein B0H13DRAFT_2304087 [Mycena leptocephala]
MPRLDLPTLTTASASAWVTRTGPPMTRPIRTMEPLKRALRYAARERGKGGMHLLIYTNPMAPSDTFLALLLRSYSLPATLVTHPVTPRLACEKESEKTPYMGPDLAAYRAAHAETVGAGSDE